MTGADRDPAEASPLVYEELAGWFHLLTAPEDYAEEAEEFRRLCAAFADGAVRTVLELGSGGGNNASHMKAHFDLTLSDRSEAMLDVSRGLNPGCEHVPGDMRTLRLDRRFDGVFVHDAVSYITTPDDLRAVAETAFVHLRPGGVAIFAPDVTKEAFAERTAHGGHDDADGRSLRYLEWVTDPDPADDTYRVDFTVVVRDSGGVRTFHDVHTCGAFPRALWVSVLAAEGFHPVQAVEEEWGDDEVMTEVFVAVRPA